MARPCAATGAAPSGQPLAVAIFTVGSSVEFGSGSVGLEPTVACSGSFEESLHAAIGSAQALMKNNFARICIPLPFAGQRLLNVRRKRRFRKPKVQQSSPRAEGCDLCHHPHPPTLCPSCTSNLAHIH